ncbi:putative ribonuclease H-like domain-containing protein [Tanacetum coccineum]
MARQCTQPKRPRNAAWYKEKAMLVEAQEAGQILDEEQLAFLADPRILAGQAQTIIPHNADVISEAQQDSMILSVIEQMSEQMINHVNNWKKANNEQNNETITVDFVKKRTTPNALEEEVQTVGNKSSSRVNTAKMLTKPQAFYDNTQKQALGYQNPLYLRKAQRIKPTLYDGVVMSNAHVAMPMIDDEETLILEEAKLSAEQAFWFHILNPTIEPPYTPPFIVDVPSELPKVSLVNASLKKLKIHLTQFDFVKKRTTPNALEEEVQTVGNKSSSRVNTAKDYALWEVIMNGILWVSIPETTPPESGTSTTIKMTVPATIEEKTCKKNDVKARSLLLMALPNEHQLTFDQYVDAQSMFAAIKARFGGNEATKKTQKALLKQQYEKLKVKKSAGASNDDKNLAFVTTSGASSTNNINTVNPEVSTATIKSNSQLNDKGFVDSGCSRHMTGNIAHLSDFKDFDGGYVTFGGGAYGGRITGKDNLGKSDEKRADRFLCWDIHLRNGPKWLFDLDSLTQSMNYVPVVAGKSSNDFAGIQGVSESSTSSQQDQDWILMPIWKDASYFGDASPKIVDDAQIEDKDELHDEDDATEESHDGSNLKENGTADPQVNTARPDINTGSREVSTALPEVNTATPEDLVGPSPASEDSHVEVQEIELGNIPQSYEVPTTPHTRIHKDHPIEHVIEEGIDYDEVFAPWLRIEAIRLFLAYASYMGFMVYQMDVKSAFLYGQIEEEVYVCQPPGFEDLDHPDKVYKVVKALYGLHQAPRAWCDTLATYLLCNGFERGKIDQTLFIKRHKGHILLVQIYVDDIIFGSTKKELCDEFEKLMKDKFQMSSMGELTFFLGLQVQQKKKGIFISQDKYVHEILRKFNYSDVKSASTPTDLEKPLVQDGDAAEVDEHLYRSMIGSLMYLTASMPDIIYLKGKPSLGLWYSKDSSLELVAYTDSDYAGATQDRKSTTGGCQFLGNRLISWQCKKHNCSCHSTMRLILVLASCCGQGAVVGSNVRTGAVVGSNVRTILAVFLVLGPTDGANLLIQKLDDP